MTNSVRAVRAREYTDTEGTGTYTVNNDAIAGYQTFTTALTHGDRVDYYIQGDSAWEVGQGVWDETAKTLTRATIFDSSNAGGAVDWIAGTKTIGVTVSPQFYEVLKTGPWGGDPGAVDGTDCFGFGNATVNPTDQSSFCGPDATVDGGTNSGWSFVWGSGALSADEAYGSIVLGDNCTAGVAGTSKFNCHARGFRAVSYWSGTLARAYGRRAVDGDAQALEVPINILTTDGVETDMVIGADSLISNEDMDLNDNRLYVFEGLIGAWQYGGTAGTVGDSGAYHIQGAAKVVSGTISLVGTPTVTTIGEDQAAWGVTVTVDDTPDSLDIGVTGETDKNIHWHGHLHFVEVG